MKLRMVHALGIAMYVALAASSMPSAQATNINFGTNQCQPYFRIGDIHNDVEMSINFSATDTGFLVCSVPRTPLSPTATTASFYVDGNGAGTSCALASYNYTGAFLGSVTFSNTPARYDQYLSLPAAQVPYYAYTYLFCSVPGGFSSNGIRGVTSLDW